MKEHLRKIRFIALYKKGDKEFVRPRTPLLYRIEPVNKVYPQEKIRNYILSVSTGLRISEGVKRRAYEIADKVEFNPELEGREPRRVSAAILNVACQMRGEDEIVRISNAMDVNSSTVSKISKMIIKILRSGEN